MSKFFELDGSRVTVDGDSNFISLTDMARAFDSENHSDLI